jgi:hypothetical protein
MKFGPGRGSTLKNRNPPQHPHRRVAVAECDPVQARVQVPRVSYLFLSMQISNV